MEKYLILLLLTVTINVSGQAPLDSAKLFKDFELHGRTTAGAYTHFTDLMNEGRETLLLSPVDLQTLNSITQNSSVKKHKQTKFGLDNLFIIGFRNGKEERIIITSGVIIVNLTLQQEHHLTEEQKTALKQLTDSWKE